MSTVAPVPTQTRLRTAAAWRRRWVGLVAAVAVLAGGLVGGSPAAAVSSAPVATLLAALTVEPENTSPYNRADFKHWIDADKDGCNTRAEVLKIESQVPTTQNANCTIQTGKWFSYYDGKTWTVGSDLDIDHMVPLSEAWDSGAQRWTATQREAYANDLDWDYTLVAVTNSVNRSKGDRDPAEWLPPDSSVHCQYIGEWVSVKYRWGLSVDPTEKNAINGLLSSSCAGATVQVPPVALGGTPPPPPPAPPAADLTAYVTAVYRDLFGRAPDAQGLATWTTKLASGTPYGAVANSITASKEFRSGLIRQSYADYLDRAPDAPGLEHWLTQMSRGMHIEQMQMGFIASPEYYAKAGGTPQGWVTRLYQHVLDRGPAPAEVTFWVDQMARGKTRSQVARGFLYSTEHLTTVVDGYYQLLLRRSIDPSGRATWVTKIQQGSRDEEIIASIVSSAEYRSKV